MSNPPPFVQVQLQGNVWQQVEWISFVTYPNPQTLSKHYICPPGTHVDWRWFSSGVPPYWQGSFVGDAWIWHLPTLYLSLQFKPSINCICRIAVT